MLTDYYEEVLTFQFQVGEPIVGTLYGGVSPEERAIVQLPLVLYQGFQVGLGHVSGSSLVCKPSLPTHLTHDALDNVDHCHHTE